MTLRKMMLKSGLALCLALGVFAANRLGASAVLHFPLEDLTATATHIVHARVDSSSAAWEDDNTRIWTTYRLDVKETIKGTFDGEARCHARGGVAGRKAQSVSGEAYLTTGKEYVLFLWQGEDKRYRILGMGQGAFEVSGTGDEAQAANTFRGLRIVNRAGEEVDVEKIGPIKDGLKNLKSRVKALLPKPDPAPERKEDPKADDASKDKPVQNPEVQPEQGSEPSQTDADDQSQANPAAPTNPQTPAKGGE